jgi:hypothetical protein
MVWSLSSEIIKDKLQSSPVTQRPTHFKCVQEQQDIGHSAKSSEAAPWNRKGARVGRKATLEPVDFDCLAADEEKQFVCAAIRVDARAISVSDEHEYPESWQTPKMSTV